MSSKGEIDKFVALDCETSGLNWAANKSGKNESVAKGYQAVSWGLVISDVKTYKPIDELYVEIKWNGKSHWDSGAEKIHGLSKEYLEEHGMDEEEEAAVEMVEFIMKHIDISNPIYLLGHNVAGFDLPFLKDLFYRYEFEGLKFGHRHFDTFSLSMGTVKQHNSNDLFKKLGLPIREDHNALEDAKYALEVFRRINVAWNKMLERS